MGRVSLRCIKVFGLRCPQFLSLVSNLHLNFVGVCRCLESLYLRLYNSFPLLHCLFDVFLESEDSARRWGTVIDVAFSIRSWAASACCCSTSARISCVV